MIGSLRGTLLEKRPNLALVDVSGVGYQVQIPLSTFANLGALHSEVSLLIHTHVREDQISLYGFLSAREKQCFELLISASGVGPSLALKILSGMSLMELVPAIRKGDLEQLVRIPGIGRKTAERIVVELRDKLAAVDLGEAARPAARSQVEADVASALENLGYDPRLAAQAIERARGEADGNFESLLREALRQLSAPAAERKARAGQGAAG
ncbi:MAG: Holliday junction branch migration protein RuvA [Candidatus Acidiferrales bacterium]